jgi:hypothetical protein
MIFKYIQNSLNLPLNLNNLNRNLKTILKHKKIAIRKQKTIKIKRFHHKYGNLKLHSKLGADNHHQILNLQKNKLINFFNLKLKITKINNITKVLNFQNNKIHMQNNNKITNKQKLNNKIATLNNLKLLKKLGISNKATNH